MFEMHKTLFQVIIINYIIKEQAGKVWGKMNTVSQAVFLLVVR